VSQSASESSESRAVRHAKPLINKKKNARFGARAQLVGVTRDSQCHKIEATRHLKLSCFVHCKWMSHHCSTHTAHGLHAELLLNCVSLSTEGQSTNGAWGRGKEGRITHVGLCVCICPGSNQHSDDAVVTIQHGSVQRGASELCKRTAHSRQREDD
jgi:hypothetical protein